MTRAQTLAINQHWQDFGLVVEEELNLHNLFPDKDMVILEIGSGMGEATAEIAQASSEVGYVAVEMHQPGLAALILLILEKQLSNIKLIREDATYLLANFIADNSIDGIHLLFPDPWPKNRQHNNANVISIGQRMHDQGFCLQLVDTFLETSFSADERHVRRINQISNYENKGSI